MLQVAPWAEPSYQKQSHYLSLWQDFNLGPLNVKMSALIEIQVTKKSWYNHLLGRFSMGDYS